MSTSSMPHMSGSSNARVNAIESPPSTTKARSTSVASSRPITSGGNGCSFGPAMTLPIANGLGGRDHLGDGGKSELFEIGRIGHRHVLARNAGDRRIQIIEGVLHDAGSDFGADAGLLPALLDRQRAAGLLDGSDDGLGIHRADGAEINHLGLDAFLGEFF